MMLVLLIGNMLKGYLFDVATSYGIIKGHFNFCVIIIEYIS